MDWDRDSWIGEGKVVVEAGTNGKLVTSFHKQADPQTVCEQQPLWKPALATPFFFRYPSFYCWAWCYMVRNTPLANSGYLSHLCPLPVYCPHLACLLIRWAGMMTDRVGEAKMPWYRTVQQQPRHWCFISTVLATNPKHSAIWTAMKNVNSSPARRCTCTFSASSEIVWQGELIFSLAL